MISVLFITDGSAQVHGYEIVYSTPLSLDVSFIWLNHHSKSQVRSSGSGLISSRVQPVPSQMKPPSCSMTYTPNLRTQPNSYIPLYYFIVTAIEADGGRVHYTASRFQVLLK